MQKRIAGSILITLAILMALMPLAKATTQHYWWDSVYFFEDDTPYPHPDIEYYGISRYSDWNIEGTRLYHCQVNFPMSDLVVKASIGFWTVVGAVLGAKIGGTTGAIVGGFVGVAVGLIITVVADVLLLDERGCIWWWISEDFVEWVINNTGTLYYYINTNPVVAALLITNAFNTYGYFRVGGVTLFDIIDVGTPSPSTRKLHIYTSSGGTTDPDPGTYTYDYYSSVNVTASAYTSYTFDGWILDESVVVWDNPINVTMDSDHTLKAYFSWVGPGVLTISASTGGTTDPAPGTYTYDYGESVTVKASAYGPYYVFDYWLLDGFVRYSHPITVTMDSDHTLTAYFEYTGWVAPPCPTLFVWNGNDYVDYGVIDIHNPSGEDVVREVSIAKQDLAVEDSKVKIRLQEGWEGLEFSESVIDQVELYAINEDGKQKRCPLLSAEHSRLGDVQELIVSSDDVKAQILLLETIGLTFKVSGDVQGFTFVIEGCNIIKWDP